MAVHSYAGALVSVAIRLPIRMLELVIVLALYLGRVRFLRLSAPGRIGHLASEIDVFIKGRKLGLRPWCWPLLVLPEGHAANESLLEYWKRYVTVLRSPHQLRLLGRFERFALLRCDISVAAIDSTAPYFDVQRAWGSRPPIVALTSRDRESGQSILRTLGIPENAEYVCFHPREAGYSPSDDDLHRFRNASLESYLLAIKALTERGIWCIRMGHPSSRSIGRMDRVVDYAHSSVRSDAADVFLCGSCKFFLGSSSGLLFLSNVFGRPTGSANHAPLSTVLAFGINDVAIPKLLWSEDQSRYLTFREVFESPVGNFRFTRQYEQHGIRVVENSAEDVRDLALEMMERVEGSAVYSHEDEQLQRQFKTLMRPGHYGFGGVNRVGRAFLRKYRSLLGE